VPDPYEGAHGFVFLHDDDMRAPAEVISELRQNLRTPENPDRPIFFADTFQGDFAGFAHFAADDLEGLANLTGSLLFDAGVHSDYAVEGVVYKHSRTLAPKGPKRKSPRFCAICRVRTSETPAVVLDAIGQAFDESEPFVGGSRVIGTFQLLIELGSDDDRSLQSAIERMLGVSGVAAAQIATTDTGRGEDEGRGA
jgi:hypothetical protein